MTTTYLLLKTVHILAVVLFLGNIITGVFWKLHADRTGDARIVAHTIQGIIGADRIFTGPSVMLLTLAGVAAALVGGIPMLSTDWVLGGIVLLVVAGFSFGTQVGPLQRRMLKVARADAPGAPMDWARYHALSKRWMIWGIIATAAPILAVILMVLKPVR